MQQQKKRLVRQMAATAALILLFCFGLIWIQYQEYQDQMFMAASIIQTGDKEADIFRILKGNRSISGKEAEKILEQYGYDSISKSEYGRNYLKKSIAIMTAGCILYVCYGALLFYDYRKRKKEWDLENEELVEIMEQIRNGNFHPDYFEKYTDAKDSRNKVLDEIDSLCGYLEILTSQSQKEKEETKALVTDISHQLKTPVAALKSCFEILKSKDLTEEEQKEFEYRLENQLKGLEQLVQALVNISRMETGMIQIRLKEEKIFDTILEAVNRVWIKAEKKKIEIELDAKEEMETFRILHDKKWICEALINLLENAVKYSPEESKVLICVKKTTTFLRIEVHDQGIGIPKSEYHKIFQRFYRGDNVIVQQEEGSGVGLYLARKIVEEHHGMLSLDTRKMRKEKGSIFVIQLPYE